MPATTTFAVWGAEGPLLTPLTAAAAMRLPHDAAAQFHDTEYTEQQREAARRCPHTRHRWVVTAALLATWAIVSFALQRLNVHPLDAALERYRHTRTGAHLCRSSRSC